jgi:hypothetical protein
MKLFGISGAALLGAALSVSAVAKKPAAAEEAAIRAMIERVYAPYSQPIPEAPEDGSAVPDNDPGAAMDGYKLPYTNSLGELIDKWSVLMQSADEIYNLNGFDWYCQCQDNDNATSKLIRQKYSQTGKDRIKADILFSPGQYEGKHTGAPLIFYFRRESGEWKLDDMKFNDFTTLRKGLVEDIKDASAPMQQGRDPAMP